MIEEIKKIINLPISNNTKENLILNVIAEDEKAIIYVLSILDIERKENKKLIEDMNLELSRCHIKIKEPNIIETNFVLDEVKKFYIKYKNKITHCFNQKFE